jgi:hypothetical protein
MSLRLYVREVRLFKDFVNNLIAEERTALVHRTPSRMEKRCPFLDVSENMQQWVWSTRASSTFSPFAFRNPAGIVADGSSRRDLITEGNGLVHFAYGLKRRARPRMVTSP